MCEKCVASGALSVLSPANPRTCVRACVGVCPFVFLKTFRTRFAIRSRKVAKQEEEKGKSVVSATAKPLSRLLRGVSPGTSVH